MKRRILVVEDDRKIAELVRLYLEKDGYRVQVAYDGSEGLELGRKGGQDLVVLDLMLPSIDGFDVARMLRAESKVPIIMLTARSTEDDKLRGLDIGADDYITKPFSPRELVARVRAVLRRSSEDEGPEKVQLGEVVVDFVRHEALLQGEPIHLTPKEFRLLATLAREPGRAFSRLELLEKVFGYDYEGLERTLDVHVMNLRKKIEADPAQPKYVLTVYGLGYKIGDIHTEVRVNANVQ
jgi:DNA-binding response OmpR family regulator